MCHERLLTMTPFHQQKYFPEILLSLEVNFLLNIEGNMAFALIDPFDLDLEGHLPIE